jgi:hypothetical protein
MKRYVVPVVLVFALTGLVGVSGTAPAHAGTGTIQGRVVDPTTHDGVGGVYVTARDVVNHSTVYAHATTGPAGYFTLDGIPTDEVGVAVNGTAVHYEYGWVACDHTVVPTWGAACSHGLGWLGYVRVDHT